MSNQKSLEKYLVGNKEQKEIGYLKSDISNGKVIMLSGKWGSGKTHFWQKKIQTVLNDKDKKIPNHYISLYGKTSIQEIKNEVFLKIFEGMDIFKIDDKSVKLAKNTANLIADFTKTVSVFGVNLDLSKIVDKSFEKLEKVREEQKEEKTKTLLNSGAIICFDDFERKSKDIDLNDLFGFITNLTIEFDCKVVIILYHYIVRLKLHKNSYLEANYVSFDSIYIKEEDSLPKGLIGYMNNENYNKEFIDKLKVKVNNDFNEINKIDKVALLEYINNNQSFVNSLHFINSLKIDELFEPFKQIKLESLQKINNFIETGILINE